MRQHDDIDFRSFAEKSYDFIQAIAGMARMRNEPRVRNALRIIAASPNDAATIKEVTTQIAALICRSRTFKRATRYKLCFHAVPRNVLDGPIPLGVAFDPVTNTRCAICIRNEEVGQNLLVSGRAGSGKTNAIFIVTGGLLRQRIPWWAIDFKKDYRHLLRWTEDLRILNNRTGAYNLLRPPPHTHPRKWLQVVCDVFAQVFLSAASPASKSFLMEKLDELYRRHGVYDGADSYPTFGDLADLLDPIKLKGKIPSQDMQRVYTLANKVVPLVKLWGPMARTDPGFSLEELLGHNTVFELDGYAAEYQELIVTLLLHWAFAYRIGKGERGVLKNVFIFDEAKMVYARSRATPTAYITRVTSMGREYGMGLVVADQMPSSLGEGIKANVFATIAFNLSATQDINDMAYTLGLDEQQRQYLRTNPVGTAVVRFADRYTLPFLMHVPKANLPKNVSDAEVEAHMAPYAPTEPPWNMTSDTTPRHEATTRFARPSLPNSCALSCRRQPGLSPAADSLLLDIRDRPYVGVAERFKRIGVSARQGSKAVKTLLAKKYVQEIRMPTGGRGRPTTFLEFLPKAVQAFGRQNLGPGRGGLAHRFWQQRIADYNVSLGYRADIEAYMNGKAADIGVWKPGRKVAVEIAVSSAHELENVRKDIEAGWDEVLVVALDSNVLKQVECEVRESLPRYAKRTQFISVGALAL